MRVFINKNSCMYCGLCGGACPDVFQTDIDGKPISLGTELKGELLMMAKHAESICPTWSITIDDNSTNVSNNTIY